ncbi:hypothetical protein [Brachybacterium sp.]|uniref:hypothetical protein n=1 Tax=Brachybacterium sp. TaxID=1891286 RepID=UPI002ED10981
MNTFWGCDTATMTELSGDFGSGAERMQALLARAADARRSATWFGPDAEEHRSLTDELVERARTIAEAVRRLGELLERESAAQDLCSAVEGGSDPTDPLRVRALLPFLGGGDLPRLAGAPEGGWGPLIGGPLQVEDPTGLADRLPALPDLGDLGPLIGGPLRHEPAPAFPRPAPVAPDERYDLEPGHLADAESIRRLGLRKVPVVGLVQGAMSAHEAIGGLYDGAEQLLVDNDLGSLTPLVDVARTPHTLSEPILGDGSVAGQIASGVDRGIANVLQTTGEVSTALGAGDLSGAVGAAERGLYRNIDATADVLAATPLPALAQTASDVLGTGGDVADLVSPGAGEPLHAAEGGLQRIHDDWQGVHDTVTDAEQLYDLRRQYAPMPWDGAV